ncbi:MAG: tetratricopeptide repeat protein [Myxococcales bacterium]|nr:tetratricopeptide repeat protein [Myxococcales bacterium]
MPGRDRSIDRLVRPATSLSLSLALALPPSAALAAPDGDASGDVAATAPDAADGDAASLRTQAIERFNAKDYDAAINLFERAYAVEPRPSFIFNVGRVYEEKGDYERAIERYTRFLEEPGVPLEARTTASERIKSLREIVETTKDPDTEPERDPDRPRGDAQDPDHAPDPDDAQDPDPGEHPPDPPDDRARPGRGMRIAGVTLLGVGAAALGTGIGFGVVTAQQHGELEQLTTPSEREPLAATGTRNALLADILIVSGGALLAAGIVLTAIGYTRKPATQRARAWRITPALGRGSAGLVLRGAF